MAKLSILAGATSQSINVFIQDSSSTTGAGLTGLVFNSSNLVAYYALPKAAAVAITLATLAAITTAYSSGGFKEVDATNMPGWYRLDLPDAAIASGRFVSVHLKGATNMAPCPVEIELTATNNQSANAFISGVNALAPPTNWNLTSIDANGRCDVIKLAGTTQTARDIGASVLLSAGSGTGQLDFTSGVVKANATQWLGGTIPAVNVTGVPKVDLVDWLGAAPNALVSGKIDAIASLRSNTAQAGASGTITLDASASATDNLYRGSQIVIASGTGAGQVRLITAYVGSTKVATILPTWTTTPDNTSVFIVSPWNAVDIQTWLLTTVTAATAGVPDVNTKNINNVSGASVTTINANLGLTQPLNFTGTGASALAKSDMVDVAGAAVSTSVAQLGVNAVNLGGTAQTGRDLGASVLISSGTGTGQLDVTSGVIKANLAQILATALTETSGLLAGGFKKFFNVASPTLTCVGIDQTGDSYARIGAPTGASISADLVEIEGETDGIATLNNLSTSDVLTQVNAALDTAIAELTQAAPTATPTLRTGLMLLYMTLRNKLDTNSTTKKIANNAGTVIAKKVLSDDGTTYSEAQAVAGP